MKMKVNKKIETYQDYYGTKIRFEPDSSPDAWEYYKTIYPSDGYLKELLENIFENIMIKAV